MEESLKAILFHATAFDVLSYTLRQRKFALAFVVALCAQNCVNMRKERISFYRNLFKLLAGCCCGGLGKGLREARGGEKKRFRFSTFTVMENF